MDWKTKLLNQIADMGLQREQHQAQIKMHETGIETSTEAVANLEGCLRLCRQLLAEVQAEEGKANANPPLPSGAVEKAKALLEAAERERAAKGV